MTVQKAIEPTQLFGGAAPTGGGNTVGNQRLGPDGKPLPDAKVWLNLGLPDGVDSEGKLVVQSLPNGLAFDTMRKHVINPKDTPEFQAIQTDRNDFYDMVSEIINGMDIKPGEMKEINLKVYAQRIKESQPLQVDESARDAKIARLRALMMAAGGK